MAEITLNPGRKCFFVDEKVTVTVRTYFSEEGTKEEVVEKLKAFIADGKTAKDIENEFHCMYSEGFLMDTKSAMTPEENEGFATVQIFMDEEPDECIAANGKY